MGPLNINKKVSFNQIMFVLTFEEEQKAHKRHERLVEEALIQCRNRGPNGRKLCRCSGTTETVRALSTGKTRTICASSRCAQSKCYRRKLVEKSK